MPALLPRDVAEEQPDLESDSDDDNGEFSDLPDLISGEAFPG